MRQFWRLTRFFSGIFFLFIFLLFCFVGIFYLSLFTEKGRSLIGHFIVEQINNEDFQIEIGPVSGQAPTPLLISYIHLKDKEGVWGRIENIDIKWSPLSLFRGKLSIDQFNIDHIHIDRDPKISSTSDDPFSFNFKLPRLPLSIDLHELGIKSFSFDPSIMGESLDFMLAGEAFYSFMSPKIMGQISLREKRETKIGAQLNLGIDYKESSKEMNFLVHLFDEGQGKVAHMLNVQKPTNLVLNGFGSIEDWEGEIIGDIGQKAVLNGILRLKKDKEKNYPEGFVRLKSHFPESLNSFLDKILEHDFETSVDFELKPGLVQLSFVNLKSSLFDLNFKGNANLGKLLEGKGIIDLTLFKPLPLRPDWSLFGTSKAECQLKGNWKNLDLEFSGEAHAEGLGFFKKLNLAFDTEIGLNQFLTPNISLDFEGESDVLEFETDQKFPFDLNTVHLKGEGSYLILDDQLKLSSVHLMADKMKLSGNLLYEKEKITESNLHFQHEDLKKISDWAGVALEGNLSADFTKERETEPYHLIATSNTLCINQKCLPELSSEITFEIKENEMKGTGGLTLGKDDVSLNLASSLFYKDDLLRLSDIQLMTRQAEFDRNKLSGKLNINFRKPNIIGTINGNLDDLGILSSFLDVHSIEGKASLNLVFDEDQQKRSHFVGQVKIQHVHSKMGNDIAKNMGVDLGVLRIEMVDLFKKPSGKVNATFLNAYRGDINIVQARAQIEGDLEAVHFSASLKGNSPLSFYGDFLGAYEQKDKKRMFHLTKGEGQVNNVKYELTKPLQFLEEDNTFLLSKTNLRIGKGVLSGAFAKDLQKIEADFSFIDFPLPLFNFFHPGLGVEGVLQGKVNLLQEKSNLKGILHLGVDKLSFDFGADIKPFFAAKIDGKLDNNRLSFESEVTEQKLRDSFLKIKGEVPILRNESDWPKFDDKTSIKGDCTGKINLTYLSPFLPTYEDYLEGSLDLQVKVLGSLLNPSMQGQILLENGYYENASLGTVLDQIKFRMKAYNKDLVLEELSAIDGQKGILKGNGKLALTELLPYKVDVTLTNFSFVQNDEADVKGDSHFILAGQKGQPHKLSGQTQITHARVKIPKDFQAGFEDIFEEEKDYCDDETPKFSTGVGLDLKIKLQNPLYLSGWGIESEWVGDVSVLGALEKPQINGKLKVQNGSFSLFGPSFSITKGEVLFEKEDKLIPEVELVAEHETSDLHARFVLSGSVDSPKFTLTSSPDLPQDEILSRLLFKHGTADLSPVQAIKIAHLMSKMNGTNLPLFDQLDGITSIIGLDSLEIDSSETGSAPVLKVSHRINDRMKISLEEDLQKKRPQGKLQVELTPNINVETGVSNDGQGNLGILGRWEY